MSAIPKETPYQPALCKTIDGNASDGLSIKELAGVLRSLSTLFDRPGIANREIADALARLSRTLQRYGHKGLDEVLDGLALAKGSRHTKRSVQSSLLIGINLTTLDLAKARNLVRNEKITKADLIRLATERFGIPRSRLQRESRESVKEAIEAAVGNTEALEIIAQEASREGLRRSH